MSYAAMWSGGKDSALSLWRARAAGLEVSCLITLYDRESERVRFHGTRIDVIARQAVAAGLPLRALPTIWPDMDRDLRAVLASLRAGGFRGVIFGDIHLADVRSWYEERVTAADLEHVEPLWGERPGDLLAEFVRIGGRAVITCCELARLDDSWLGRLIDESFLDDVALTGVDPCGENGEYHSFAVAGPMFSYPLSPHLGRRRIQDGFAQVDVLL